MSRLLWPLQQCLEVDRQELMDSWNEVMDRWKTWGSERLLLVQEAKTELSRMFPPSGSQLFLVDYWEMETGLDTTPYPAPPKILISIIQEKKKPSEDELRNFVKPLSFLLTLPPGRKATKSCYHYAWLSPIHHPPRLKPFCRATTLDVQSTWVSWRGSILFQKGSGEREGMPKRPEKGDKQNLFPNPSIPSVQCTIG